MSLCSVQAILKKDRENESVRDRPRSIASNIYCSSLIIIAMQQFWLYYTACQDKIIGGFDDGGNIEPSLSNLQWYNR